MSDEQTAAGSQPPARVSKPRPVRRRVTAQAASVPTAPPAPKQAPKPTIPGTDASDSDVPLLLSPDACAATRDRVLALDWMDAGLQVRKRDDGVYEQLLASVPPAKPLTLSEEFADWPELSVLERRLAEPNIETSAPILFKDESSLQRGQTPRWYKRWIDTWVPSRLQQLTQKGGYRKATWDLLHDKSEIGDRDETTHDGVVRRGDKGRYVLVYMPYPYYDQIKRAQAIQRTRREQQNMSGVAASEVAATPAFGDRGADILTAKDKRGEPMFRGSIHELPPMSPQALATSGLPKDLRNAEDVQVLDPD